MEKLAGGVIEPEEYKNNPKVCDAEDAAVHMVGKKKIFILTGAGISAASGIPTFRGQDGFWKQKKQYAGEGDPKEVLTKSFFEKHPEANWEWHYDFIKLSKDCKTNKGHKAIREFQESCVLSSKLDKENQVETMLVTQNIDDLHNREIRESKVLQNNSDKYFVQSDATDAAFMPHIYEIHGNVRYMHCSDEE